MSEKVLFELRIHADDDGTRLEVMLSPEWEAYHQARRENRREEWRDRREEWRNRHDEWRDYWPFGWWDDDADAPDVRPQPTETAADNLRNALDSLQTIYDDLYGEASA